MGAYEWRDFYESDGPELFENWKEKYPQGPHFAEGYCRNVENARLSMVCEKDFHDVSSNFTFVSEEKNDINNIVYICCKLQSILYI